MTTNAELRAAAELILLLRDDHSSDVAAEETRERLFGGMTMEAAEEKAAEMICGLARHILATVHDDDDEPLTVEFIAKNWHPTPLEGSPQWWWISDRVFLCCDDMGFWTACTPDSEPESWHPFASLMTVGDVRRLCGLLGVVLKGEK